MNRVFLEGISIEVLVSAIADKVLERLTQQTVKDTYLTTGEVCKRLGVTRQTVNRWEKEGKLTSYRVGRKLLYKETEIERAGK